MDVDVGQFELTNGLLKEVNLLSGAVDGGDLPGGTHDGQRNGREARTGPDIEDGTTVVGIDAGAGQESQRICVVLDGSFGGLGNASEVKEPIRFGHEEEMAEHFAGTGLGYLEFERRDGLVEGVAKRLPISGFGGFGSRHADIITAGRRRSSGTAPLIGEAAKVSLCVSADCGRAGKMFHEARGVLACLLVFAR